MPFAILSWTGLPFAVLSCPVLPRTGSCQERLGPVKGQGRKQKNGRIPVSFRFFLRLNMYTWLLPYLICPNCLPKEIILSLDTVTDIEDQDILSGQLICPKCRSRYLIKEGVALLTIDTKTAQADQDKYEQDKVLSSYLWSHFSDHLFEPWAEPLF